MTYKVRTAFKRNGIEYAVNDDFIGSETDAKPLLIFGLIKKPRATKAAKSRD